MAIQSTEVLPDNTLEEFRIEFNKLVTDVSGLSLGNTFDTQIIFEGTTDDTFETALSVTDPTADRSIVFPNQSGNVLLDSANITLDDDIELQFGTGSDLKIYHDGSHSYIEDAGTGNLKLQGSQVDIIGSGETMATFADDGAVTLYHNNVAIVATAATGISVTGDVVATDDLILDNDGALIQFGDDQDVTLTHVHDTGLLLNAAMVVQFRDSAINIGSPADGDLDINADDEIELNSTLIDINGNVEISGTTAAAAVTTSTIVASGIIKTDDTTAATSTTDGSLQTDGGLSVAGDAILGNDVKLLSDASILSFGADGDVTLTHVHNDGLLLNSGMKLQFRDSAINIRSDADGDLDINADDEIELNSTLIDINGNVEISGTLAQVGVLTTTATQVATGGITSGSNIVSDTDSTDDLGTTGVRWANLFVDAITATDQITATGFTGTLDGILGSGTAAAATTTTLASTTITASGIIKTDDATDATTTTDGSLQTDGGLSVVKDIVGGNDIDLLSDGAVIYFGADKDVQAFHIHNSGLTLRNNSTGDDTPFLLTLQTGETDIAASDVLGKIQFQAPDEGTGTDAILIAAAIQAVSEGDFSASNNATKLNFMTGASEAATTKMTLTSGGLVGIGTEAPGSELSVAGDMRIQQAGGRIFQLNSFAAYNLGSSGGSAIRFVEESGSHHIDFETHKTGHSHAARMRIDKEGDVSLLTDTVALKFGLDEEVTLTHVHNTGLTLNANFLQQKAGNTELMTENTTTASVKGGLQALTNQSIRVGSIVNFQTEIVMNNSVKIIVHTNGNVTPGTDNAQELGGASLRWTALYAVNGTVQTSDARDKTSVRVFSNNEIAAAKALSKEIGVFQWLDAIKKKGKGKARKHIGFTVQRAIEIMEEHSLDPMAYGFICYDEWEDEYHGTPQVKKMSAGNKYSFRQDQLNLFIARGFEARLAALE